MLIQAEMVDPCTQAISVTEAEAEGQGRIEKAWGCNDGGVEP